MKFLSNLIKDWIAPTPKLWKKVMWWSLALSAISVAILNAERVGSIIIPDFTFTLFPTPYLVWKYIFVIGLGVAAFSKFQKENPSEDDVKKD